MKFFLRWLFTLIFRGLDPELDADLAKYEAKVKAHEEDVKRLQAEIEAGEKVKAHFLITKAVNAAETKRLEDEITQTKATLEKRIKELDSLSAEARVRVDL